MKKLFFILIFALMSANAEVITKTSIRSADGVGIGKTRQEAINNAIIEALGKMDGIKVDSKKFISTDLGATNGKSDLKDKFSSRLSVLTNGKIDGFDVNNVSENGGIFEADVTIKKISTTKKYKTPGLDEKNRRKIAIFPVFSQKENYEILGENFEANKITNPLSQKIMEAFVNTRKFSVLDRLSDPRIYEIEEQIIASKSAKNDEILKLGNALGADYLFIANLANFSVSKNGSNLTTQSTNRLNVALEYRILLMATRQIKFANTQNFSFDLKGENFDKNLAHITQTMANSLSSQIINAIYPLKIAKIQNGEVVISQNLQVGEIYDVFSLGEKIIDAYTKESVGRAEIPAGKIEIIRTSPKLSYAKILSGKPKVGDICRLVSKNQSGNIGAGSDTGAKINENGGVVLPF